MALLMIRSAFNAFLCEGSYLSSKRIEVMFDERSHARAVGWERLGPALLALMAQEEGEKEELRTILEEQEGYGREEGIIQDQTEEEQNQE